jgi:uncharacterized membrane protein
VAGGFGPPVAPPSPVIITPDGAAVSSRRLSLDWLRGMAVLVMIHAHVLDAWTHPSERVTGSFLVLNILAGFAAPLFLWLAGAAMVLSGERLRDKRTTRSEVSRTLIARGLEIFVYAFAFRLLMFLFNPGGAAISIFRVDILNIMGPSLAVAALVWGAVRHQGASLLVFAGLAAAFSLLTPVVQLAAWVDAMPVWIQWYLRPAGEHTVFTLFPWAGFVFAGASSGVVLARARDAASERRAQIAIAAGGICLVAFGFYASTLPTMYRQSSFWSSSPTFFAIRVGGLMLTSGVVYAAAAVLAPRGLLLEPLQRLGRASLFIYLTHIPIVYGWMTEPFRSHLRVWQTMMAFVAFSAALYWLVLLRDRLLSSWLDRDLRGGPGHSTLLVR